ncbi:MAG: FABP family protein [Actinomycetota bacterium]
MELPKDPALHPDVAALSFLLGTWRGTGEGRYPTVDPFRYGEEMTFTHVGDPFLAYEQKSWSLADRSPLHFERGFLRGGEGGAVELVLAHPLGIVEVSTGTVSAEGGPRVLDLASVTMAHTPSGDRVTGLRRHLEVEGDSMAYTLKMKMEQVPLSPHLRAELRRG